MHEFHVLDSISLSRLLSEKMFRARLIFCQSIGVVDDLDCCQFQKLNSARHILTSNLLHTVLSFRHGSIHTQLTIANTSCIFTSLLISRPNHVGINMEPSFPKVCPPSTQSHPSNPASPSFSSASLLKHRSQE